jgi:hypothetical protein
MNPTTSIAAQVSQDCKEGDTPWSVTYTRPYRHICAIDVTGAGAVQLVMLEPEPPGTAGSEG